MRTLFYFAALCLVLALTACGDKEDKEKPAAGEAKPAGKAEVRVAHLSPDAPNVDVWVDGKTVLTNVAFKAVSDYLVLDAGEHTVKVTPTGATQPAVIDAKVTLKAKTASTVAATGLLEKKDLKPFVTEDDRVGLHDAVKVRFVHTSPDAPAVDVAVKGGPVLFTNVAFRKAGAYVTVDAGSYDLEVRLTGTETVALAVPGVQLEAGTNYSIFAIGLAGDGSLAAQPQVDGVHVH